MLQKLPKFLEKKSPTITPADLAELTATVSSKYLFVRIRSTENLSFHLWIHQLTRWVFISTRQGHAQWHAVLAAGKTLQCNGIIIHLPECHPDWNPYGFSVWVNELPVLFVECCARNYEITPNVQLSTWKMFVCMCKNASYTCII